jgi:iron complex outermembrane receptor protein
MKTLQLRLTALAVGLALSASVWAQTGPVELNIAAQPLGSALSALTQQSGAQIVFVSDVTAGKTAPAVKGKMTVRVALDHLLQGSGLRLQASDERTFTVVPVNAATANENVLPTVNVTASPAGDLPPVYAGGQVARGGGLGMLGDANFMDTPFNQTSYTAQAIEEQQARSLSDLLVNDPSVRLSSARTNINEDFSIRGFTVASADVALNGMYGLMPYFRVPVEMAERVEVLKGPSGLLNGMPPSGNVGGAINVVPKRAGDEPLTRITTNYVSDSVVGAQADIGRRFGEHKEFGVRFNGAYRDGGTVIDKQDQTDQVYTLGLDYRGERLRASLDLIYQNQDIDPVVRQFGVDDGLTAIPKAPDPDRNYPGYGRSETTDKTVVARAEYDITDDLTVYGGVGKRRHLMDALAGNITLLNAAGDFTSTPAWQVFEVEDDSYEAGANLRFNTGSIKHKVALNYSRVEENQDIYFNFTGFGSARNSNLYAPVDSDTPSTAGIGYKTKPYNSSVLTSYALADTLSFIDDKVKLTLGARHQNVQQQAYVMNVGTPSGDRYDDSAVTPVVGLVVQPYENFSLYANYIEGLSPGQQAPVGTDNAGTIFSPYKTKQYEIGTKLDWGRFATTVSVFQIERPSASTFNNVFAVNGEQRNRGVEFNIFGEVVRDIRLVGGAAYTQGTLTRTADGVNEGNDAIAVPRVQANLGVDWDNVLAPGIGLNARVIYTSSQYVDDANNLELPSWTRFDVGARYQTKVSGKAVTLRANIENVFDKAYWGSSNSGYLYVGAPRTLLVSASVDF